MVMHIAIALCRNMMTCEMLTACGVPELAKDMIAMDIHVYIILYSTRQKKFPLRYRNTVLRSQRSTTVAGG